MNLSYAQGYCWKFDNYRLAKVGEITNASEHEYSPVTYWKRNESARAIGDGSDGGAGVNEYYGGLVPEWGDLGFYTSSISNFSSDTWYWSGAFSNVASNKYIDINSTTGVIGNTSHNTEHQKALCVSTGANAPKFTFAKPGNMEPNRAASDDLWDTSNGHKRRVEFWHYAQNFPSTAAHGLYFSLLKTDRTCTFTRMGGVIIL